MKTTDNEFADMDRQTLIEMKNQAKLWDRIDNKMEDKLKILKATGKALITERGVLCSHLCWNLFAGLIKYTFSAQLPCLFVFLIFSRLFAFFLFLFSLHQCLTSSPHCSVHSHHSGVIVLESDEVVVDKYMLPAKRRWQALNDMLTFLVSPCSPHCVFILSFACVGLWFVTVFFFAGFLFTLAWARGVSCWQ